MPVSTHQYAACRLVIEDPAKPGTGETLRDIPFNIEHLAKRFASLHELFEQCDNYLRYELKYTPCPDLGPGYKGNVENFIADKTYTLHYDGQFIGVDLVNNWKVGGSFLWSDDVTPKIYLKWNYVDDFEKSMTGPTYARHTNNGHYGF